MDYSKAAVYKCKLADYSKAVVYKCKAVDYSKAAVYKCKPPVYSGLHTGKLHDHDGVWVLDLKLILKLPVNQRFAVKLWFRICKVVVYSKAAVYNL